jgi:putative FmdB family regulatory protein
MPIYEYQCKSCGHELEAIQKISDDPLKECPACGDLELTKLISAAGFRLKGGGWYETDFKSGKDKKKNLAGGESSSGSSDAGKSEAPKAESKPAAGGAT